MKICDDASKSLSWQREALLIHYFQTTSRVLESETSFPQRNIINLSPPKAKTQISRFLSLYIIITFLWWETFKYILLLTIVIMLYIRLLDIIHLITASYNPITIVSPFSPSPSSWQLQFYCFYEFGFLDSTYKRDDTIFFFLWFNLQ